MQQQLAIRGAPHSGVAFYAAPTAVRMVMGWEPWRERPRMGAMNASRAPPRGRSRHGSPVWVGVVIGARSVRKFVLGATHICHDKLRVFFMTSCESFECSTCTPGRAPRAWHSPRPTLRQRAPRESLMDERAACR